MSGLDMQHADFWKGRRVFLTGHTGFKGSWLSFWLTRLGAVVHGFALEPATTPSLFEQASIEQLLACSTLADIRDLPTLDKAIRLAKPEIVIHLAAQPLVRRAYADPVATYATNVMGTVHLLEAVRSAPSVRSVVIVTTDKCYENREWVWGYRESDSMGGHDPYSSSKACAELVTSSYRNAFFHPDKYGTHRVAIASARAGNVIGGGDWTEDRLLPDIFRALSSGQTALIRNPLATRPWQHVLEPLRGYLDLARALHQAGPRYGEAFNFGPQPHDAWAVGRVADHLCRDWGGAVRWQQDQAAHPHESRSLALDISKARALLGWEPRLNIVQALKFTCEMTKSLLSGENARALMLEQILMYESLCEHTDVSH